MYPIILNLFGPLKIHSYSLAIFTGLMVLLYFVSRHKVVKKIITFDQISNILSSSVLWAIIGGRILHVYSEFDHYNTMLDMISIWNGGLSSLGAVIALSIYLPIVFYNFKISDCFSILDIAGIYIPLFQSIARIGCFLAGCCYGAQCHYFWAVNYTNPDCFAPLNISLHPTQLYSSLAFFIIFLIINLISKRYYFFKGQLIFLYLILMSVERFSLDLLRGDRNIFPDSIIYNSISIDQWISFLIFIIGIMGFYFFRQKNLRPQSE